MENLLTTAASGISSGLLPDSLAVVGGLVGVLVLLVALRFVVGMLTGYSMGKGGDNDN